MDKTILERVAVSSTSPIPLYLQLGTSLRQQITEGQLAPGTPLPTVQALAKRCGMSQATVMRAITELASEGLIVTRRGARSVVAARRAASTEVLVGNLSQAPTLRELSFFNQLLEGLREGYHDPERRFLTTYTSADPVHGEELIRVCQVAQADGIVAFRPRKVAIAPLREVAGRIPVVSLFHPVPDAPADLIQADAVPALQRWVRERVAKGVRRFYYVGAYTYFLTEPAGSPYESIYRAAVEIMRGGGLELVEIDVPHAAEVDEWPRFGRDIPDGSAVVAGNPRLALACEGPSPRLDTISYTEFRATLDAAADRMTVLYLGLETVGAAAAELLQSRVRSGNSLPARTVRLSPTVVSAGAVAG